MRGQQCMSHVRERILLECVCLCTCVFVCVGGSDGWVNVYRYKKTCTMLVYNRAFIPQESRAKKELLEILNRAEWKGETQPSACGKWRWLQYQRPKPSCASILQRCLIACSKWTTEGAAEGFLSDIFSINDTYSALSSQVLLKRSSIICRKMEVLLKRCQNKDIKC